MAGNVNDYYGIEDYAGAPDNTPLDPAKVAAVRAQAAQTPAEPAQELNTAGTAYNPFTGTSADPTSPAGRAAAPAPAPTNPYGTTFDVAGLAKHLHDARMADVGEGMGFAGNFYGQGNAQMAEIENAQRQRALNGFSPEERSTYSQAANQGINQQLSTGIRAVRGAQATNGVRGGAAGGQFAPVLNQANQARAKSETDLNVADYAARQRALSDYQGTVSGERSGMLGTAFGFAGAGAGDRASALQYGLGQDDLMKANAGVAAAGTPDFSDHPWNAKDSMDQWKQHNYDPNYFPVADYLHKNVWDKKDNGINVDPYNPLGYIK